MESFEEKKQGEAIVIADKEDIRKFQVGVWGQTANPIQLISVTPIFLLH
ncbi:hypothetical protein GLW00_16060 [Halobacillus litoralis]|uniref:Uncharacterized protein n=1 Tax=Halobacillus litoralis TaxID=45668 RepID=A0A845FES3_9BACI|nr:hypothetical protein [Halobacillus litoralis]MYL72361.1 hypothetical protein [Halobacillus litoralis]